jgi:hypothetical protein
MTENLTQARTNFLTGVPNSVCHQVLTGAGAAHKEHEEHEQVIGTHKVRFWTRFHIIF